MTNNKKPLIGIDLGTTNSLVAYWDGEQAQLIANALGETLTPSAVSLDADGTVHTGRAAFERRISHPELTAVAFKRAMGSTKRFRVGAREFGPEELSSLVLGSLKADAEAALHAHVTDAIISVPAYFNDTQRKATKAAAEIAGLNVMRLINEPTAAALAYGLHQAQDETKFLVFDLGGGTFDVSIVELFEGVIEVKASTGDNYLGGEDFTTALAAHLAEKLGLKWGSADIELGLQARIMGAAERCKFQLSQAKLAEAKLNFEGKEHLLTITEETFESLCEPLLERLRKPIERALRDARLKPDALSKVVLVGGATRMPLVRKVVTKMFGRFPDTTVHPDHAIALGAAIQAALVANDAALSEVLMTDVSPYSLGIAVSESLSNGNMIDGLFSPIIERNTVVPASRFGSYSSLQDGQKHIDLKIYQGEQRYVKDNVYLGELQVPIPAKKRGEVSIEVRFTYDSSGLLDIDVAVPLTGETHNLALLGNASALSPKEIAERKDKLAALKIHPRETLPNKALIARVERMYAEMSGATREAVGRALTEFLSVIDNQDPEQMSRHRKHLSDWLDGIEQTTLD